MDSRPNFVIPVAEIVFASHTKHKVCKSSGAAWPNWNPRSVRQLQTVTVTRFRNCLEHLITNSSQVFRCLALNYTHAALPVPCPFVSRAYNALLSRLTWTPSLNFDAGNVAWNNSFLYWNLWEGNDRLILFFFFFFWYDVDLLLICLIKYKNGIR